jgi:membrane protein DedA with SNARE-associated domain
MDIVGLIITYKYAFLFIGMFLLGEAVFLPAIYLSLLGYISLPVVILVSLFATLISDVIWYYIASHRSVAKIQHWHRVEKHKEKFVRLSALFDRRGGLILFASKFVYGTRILVQVICGMKRMNIWKYLFVNTIGSLAYLLFLTGITMAVDAVFLPEVIGGVKISLIVLVAVVVLINLGIKYITQKLWLQS